MSHGPTLLCQKPSGPRTILRARAFHTDFSKLLATDYAKIGWAIEQENGKVMPHIERGLDADGKTSSANQRRQFLWIASKDCFDDKPTG
jgi:hypothetical protein